MLSLVLGRNFAVCAPTTHSWEFHPPDAPGKPQRAPEEQRGFCVATTAGTQPLLGPVPKFRQNSSPIPSSSLCQQILWQKHSQTRMSHRSTERSQTLPEGPGAHRGSTFRMPKPKEILEGVEEPLSCALRERSRSKPAHPIPALLPFPFSLFPSRISPARR